MKYKLYKNGEQISPEQYEYYRITKCGVVQCLVVDPLAIPEQQGSLFPTTFKSDIGIYWVRAPWIQVKYFSL